MADEKVIQLDPNVQQNVQNVQNGALPQGPSREEIELQKKVWLKDHEMRKADIIIRALSVGTQKDSVDAVLFTPNQREELEERVFDILKELDNVEA